MSLGWGKGWVFVSPSSPAAAAATPHWSSPATAACSSTPASARARWDDTLADHLADVDLLAVEFNHDVDLEYSSGRSPMLIQRVLGDEGHLSNAQAAALVRAVLARSPAGRLRHLVQLHLSRDCNLPGLARESARAILAELADGAELHTAEQDTAGATLEVSAAPGPSC